MTKSVKHRARKKEKEPLQFKLSVAIRFGDEEEDRVVLMEDHELVMVGSIFRYRDKISSYMVSSLLRVAMLQPRVAAKVLPGLKAFRRKE